MTEKRKTEIQQRFKKKDHDRLAKKAVEHVTGEYVLSTSSAESATHIVHGYQEQDKQDKKHAGSHPKRNEGVWQATLEILGENPNATPKQAWKMLESVDALDWAFEIEDDLLFTCYYGRDRQRKNPDPLRFNAFRIGYVYEARKKLGITVE